MDSLKTIKATLFIDNANWHYGLKETGWQVDFKKLIEYFKREYNLISAFYYDGIPSEKYYMDRHPKANRTDFLEYKTKKKGHHKLIKSFGYFVRTKPIGRIYDSTEGIFKYKCNFDVELTIDALDNIVNYDICILGSGDGDFTKLVKYLKGKYKRVIVIANPNRISTNLLISANKVLSLNTLRQEIELKQEPK